MFEVLPLAAWTFIHLKLLFFLFLLAYLTWIDHCVCCSSILSVTSSSVTQSLHIQTFSLASFFPGNPKFTFCLPREYLSFCNKCPYHPSLLSHTFCLTCSMCTVSHMCPFLILSNLAILIANLSILCPATFSTAFCLSAGYILPLHRRLLQTTSYHTVYLTSSHIQHLSLYMPACLHSYLIYDVG